MNTLKAIIFVALVAAAACLLDPAPWFRHATVHQRGLVGGLAVVAAAIVVFGIPKLLSRKSKPAERPRYSYQPVATRRGRR